MKIGCQRHTHDVWKKFNDDEIAIMSSGALEFWKEWKLPLLSICDSAQP